MTLPKVAIDRLRQLKKIQEQDARIRKAFGPGRKIEDAIAFCRNYLEFNNFQLVPSVILNPKDVEIDYDEVYELFSYPDVFKEGELHPEWKKQLQFCTAFLLECGYKDVVDTYQTQEAIERERMDKFHKAHKESQENLATTTSNKVKDDREDYLKTLFVPAGSDMMTISVSGGSSSPKYNPETLEYSHKVDILFMSPEQVRDLKEYCLRQAVDGLMKQIKQDLEKYVEIKQERVTDISGEFVYTKAKIKVTPIK